MPKNKALFLDRDGVICKALDINDGKHGYLIYPEELELMPGVKELISFAKEKNYLIIVVTNQPQIAKGLLGEKGLLEIHSKMQNLLNNKIDKIYYCPHRDEDNCGCRKPKPGMLIEAQKDFNLDLKTSVIVGDSDKDILAGRAAGCKTIFVKNAFHERYANNCSPDHVIENCREVIQLI